MRKPIFSPDVACKVEEKMKNAFSDKDKNEKMHQLGLISVRGSHRKPTHENFEKWLEIFEWSYKDFYKQICGIDISWGNSKLELICRYLDTISDESAAKIYEMAIALLPDTTRHQLDISDNYLNFDRRITDMIMVKGNEDDKAITTFQELGLEGKWNNKNCCSVVPMDYYPSLASRFGMSLHWMLNLDASSVILAQKGRTEVVMDVIAMLPDSAISTLYSAILLVMR